ncbi:MAG: hypothetical protein HXY40_17950 [Chloroflexi bacterium]|nr:hypothetical protein [Chloroflexota bacterium]
MSGVDFSTVLNFSADDLAQNRAGRLSAAQAERLRGQHRRSILVGAATIGAGILLATSLLFFGQQQQSAILSLVGIGVTLLNAAMMGIFLRHGLHLSADMRAGTVQQTCGAATFTVRMLNRRTALYIVHVEGAPAAEVAVSREAFEVFRKCKGGCCLYRTLHTGALLSAEAL